MFEINKIASETYALIDKDDCYIYLLIGKNKTLVIDLGDTKIPIKPEIEKITSNDLIVALTHGHGDHVAKSLEFDKVYLSPLDKNNYLENELLFPNYYQLKSYQELLPLENFKKFDLGDRIIETFPLGGHTPGSTVFVDKKNKFVFCGDALGAGKGVWIQCLHGTKIREYKKNLMNAKKYLNSYGVDNSWYFWTGHQKQVYRSNNPISLELIDDMIVLCNQLIKGNTVGEKSDVPTFDGTQGYYASYKKAGIFYKDSSF